MKSATALVIGCLAQQPISEGSGAASGVNCGVGQQGLAAASAPHNSSRRGNAETHPRPPGCGWRTAAAAPLMRFPAGRGQTPPPPRACCSGGSQRGQEAPTTRHTTREPRAKGARARATEGGGAAVTRAAHRESSSGQGRRSPRGEARAVARCWGRPGSGHSRDADVGGATARGGANGRRGGEGQRLGAWPVSVMALARGRGWAGSPIPSAPLERALWRHAWRCGGEGCAGAGHCGGLIRASEGPRGACSQRRASARARGGCTCSPRRWQLAVNTQAPSLSPSPHARLLLLFSQRVGWAGTVRPPCSLPASRSATPSDRRGGPAHLFCLPARPPQAPPHRLWPS